MEEESGVWAHCGMPGELAVQRAGHLGARMLHPLGTHGAYCADLIGGVQCGARLNPPLQAPHNGSVFKAQPVSTDPWRCLGGELFEGKVGLINS